MTELIKKGSAAKEAAQFLAQATTKQKNKPIPPSQSPPQQLYLIPQIFRLSCNEPSKIYLNINLY